MQWGGPKCMYWLQPIECVLNGIKKFVSATFLSFTNRWFDRRSHFIEKQFLSFSVVHRSLVKLWRLDNYLEFNYDAFLGKWWLIFCQDVSHDIRKTIFGAAKYRCPTLLKLWKRIESLVGFRNYRTPFFFSLQRVLLFFYLHHECFIEREWVGSCSIQIRVHVCSFTRALTRQRE